MVDTIILFVDVRVTGRGVMVENEVVVKATVEVLYTSDLVVEVVVETFSVIFLVIITEDRDKVVR